MAKPQMGEGFRYSKVMAWAPAILILMGLAVVVWGDTTLGILVVLAGVIFGLLVKRRGRRVSREGRPLV